MGKTKIRPTDAGITDLLTVLDREATEDDEESGK